MLMHLDDLLGLHMMFLILRMTDVACRHRLCCVGMGGLHCVLVHVQYWNQAANAICDHAIIWQRSIVPFTCANGALRRADC